jgi:hypothetical protein
VSWSVFSSVAGKLSGIRSLLVSESVSVLVSVQFSSVQCSAQSKEEASTVSEQWCCCEVTSEQRTDLKIISGYVLWDNILIHITIIYEYTALQQKVF